MRSNLFAILYLAVFSLKAIAQEVEPSPVKAVAPAVAARPTAEAIEARRQARLEKTGGFVQRPLEGPVVLYVNAQKRFPASVIEKSAGEIAGVTQFPFRVDAADPSGAGPLELAGKTVSVDPKEVAFAVVLVDDPSLPSVLIAPEACWVILNVAGLTGSKPVSEDVMTARLGRQLWRTTTWVMGGGTSPMNSAMSPAFSAEDLDAIGPVTAPDLLGRMLDVGQRRGMRPRGMATYRKAVEEGWAPEPENVYQQRIWDELKGTAAPAVEAK